MQQLALFSPKIFSPPPDKICSHQSIDPPPTAVFINLIYTSLALPALGISQEWNLGPFLTEFVHTHVFLRFLCVAECISISVVLSSAEVLSIRCALWAGGLTLWSLAGTDILTGRAS